jgi:hypothetical protein
MPTRNRNWKSTGIELPEAWMPAIKARVRQIHGGKGDDRYVWYSIIRLGLSRSNERLQALSAALRHDLASNGYAQLADENPSLPLFERTLGAALSENFSELDTRADDPDADLRIKTRPMAPRGGNGGSKSRRLRGSI